VTFCEDATKDLRLLIEPLRPVWLCILGPRIDVRLGSTSLGVDLASSGLNWTRMTISCDRWDVSRVFQYCHAASVSKSSRQPGNGSLAAMFFRHVYIDSKNQDCRIEDEEIVVLAHFQI